MDWRFLVSLVFAVIIAVFAIGNSNDVVVNFIFAEYELSQAVVILISAMFGALVVAFLGIIRQVKSNLRIRNLGKEIDRLETEKTQLNNNIIELKSQLSLAEKKAGNLEHIEVEEVTGESPENTIKKSAD